MKHTDDDGFTLIELLITIVLTGIVTLALGDAVGGFIRNADTTTHRLTDSRDAQITARYFAQDVASIGVRNATTNGLQQSVDTTGTALACGPAADPPRKVPVVRFAWDDPASLSVTAEVRVAYVLVTVGTERQLHRFVCNGSAVVETNTVIVHDVAVTAPVVTCTPSPCSGAGDKVPQLVTMVLAVKDPDNPGPEYTVTLSGSRRQT